MPADAGGDDRGWLVEPPGANDVVIHVDVGEGVELSDDVRESLDVLMASIFGAEVEGFATKFPGCPSLCGALSGCGEFWCTPLGKCSTLTAKPCFVDARCAICNVN